MEGGRHTILLLQQTANLGSRTYYDFERVADAIDGVVRMFEQRLMNSQPGATQISYDISDLMRFIDGLHDLAALIYNPAMGAYEPHNKQWIKQSVTRSLERQARR